MTLEVDAQLKISQVARISPSRFAYLRSCALYEACRSAGQPSLLPTSPAGHIGGIAHRLLERAARGEFVERTAIESAWDQMVEDAETQMRASLLDRRFVPLRATVRQYQVRRIQACRKAEWLAENVAAASPSAARTRNHTKQFELWLQSPDELVGGYVDYIEEAPDGAIIRDYKTGALLEMAEPESKPTIKAAYLTQLHLYAALYWSNHGRWPKRLELVPLVGPAVIVPFDPEKCVDLLEEAKQTLRGINSRIQAILAASTSQIEELATPSPEACRFCEFRAGCEAYWKQRTFNGAGEWPIDVRGRVVRQKTFANGKTTVEIVGREDGIRYRITGLRAPKYPILAENREGGLFAAYNLRPESMPTTFSDTTLTAIYFHASAPNELRAAIISA